MIIKGVTAMFFSGTGNTKKMTLITASMLAMKLGVPFTAIDFSTPEVREQSFEFKKDEVLVIGTPVYAGRVPNLLLPFLKDKIKGAGSPCVPVVTFGNRAYDNALVELRDIMTANGFRAIAAGAFAAAHSFSTVLGAGRPDSDDMFLADELAIVTSERLEAIGYREATTLEKMKLRNDMPVEDDDTDTCECSAGDCDSGEGTCEGRNGTSENGVVIPVPVPGDISAGYYQPRDREGNPIDIRKVKPVTNDLCDNCKLCAEICPMGAIDMDDVKSVTGICIKCCACVKRCPKNAKYFDDAGYIYHKEELEAMYGDFHAKSEIF